MSDASDQATGLAQFDDPEETRVLYATLDSFRQYRKAAHYNITHLRRQSFYSLSSAHNDILCAPPFNLPATFQQVDDAIDHNAEVAELILAYALPSFGIDPPNTAWHGTASSNDVDKARSTIRQLYRDWSSQGAVEREACFVPIISALQEYLPASYEDRGDIAVLVPGAGLGRLVLDLCLTGYTVEGNEISYHQLCASNFMLNYTNAAEQYMLYPWALSFSNLNRRIDQFRGVAIPDLHPATALATTQADHPTIKRYSERMSMSAGDFCVVYRQAENANKYDAVTTCFFIDTAPNLINYIETVKCCLKPNGVWINLGPLLWHFEAAATPAASEGAAGQKRSVDTNKGIGDPGSFELAEDEVVGLIEQLGFRIEKHQEMPAGATGYIQDPASMLQNIYKPVFWVARRL